MTETLQPESSFVAENELTDEQLYAASFENNDETEAALVQLEVEFGDRIFNYKSYSGTVAQLYSSCPAFPIVLAKGYDYARNWLEGNDQPAEDTPDSNEDDNTEPDSEPDADESGSVGNIEPDVKADDTRAVAEAESARDISGKTSEANVATRSPGSGEATKALQAAVIARREGAKQRESTALSAPLVEKKQSKSDSGVQLIAERDERNDSSVKVVPADDQSKLQEAQPQVTEIIESHIDNKAGVDSSSELLPEHTPELAKLPIQPAVEVTRIGEIDGDANNEPTPNDGLEQLDGYILHDQPALHVPTEFIGEVLTVDVTEPRSDQVELTESQEAEPRAAVIETTERVEIVDTIDDESDIIPFSDIATQEGITEEYDVAEEDPAVARTHEMLELYESNMDEPSVETEIGVADIEDVTENYEDAALPVQEVIEVMEEITGELPDLLPEEIPLETVRQISKLEQGIHKLETARTAKECHEALVVIRVELASLLSLLGYDNAGAIAERLVQQYDMATLKNYLAQLMRLLESRRSKSIMTRQMRLKPLHRRFGIHAVGRVVLLGRTPQFAA